MSWKAWGFHPSAAAGAAALLALPMAAQAETGPTQPFLEVAETVVVTAQRTPGPGVAVDGASDYSVTAADIAALPAGTNTALSDVLTQMPGVSADQNQQIHIRDTEGPQFQYQINGALVPLDINTNPPFLSMINPQFVRRLDLLTGVLPARYSYATGGIVDIATKDGCSDPGGSLTLFGGMRSTFSPSAEYGGCAGRFGYYVSALYQQSNTAFSSATPGPDAIHDWTNQGQGFGHFTYALDDDTKLSLVLSGAASDNQLPNVGGLTPQYVLAGATAKPSSAIDSDLDFRDALAILTLDGALGDGLSYKLSYAAHSISEDFRPDNAGELIYQGVASTASHVDHDNSLQGDIDWQRGSHDLGAGFYIASYDVTGHDSSLVFPVDPATLAVGTTPVTVTSSNDADNVVVGLYLGDLWQLDDRWRLNLGLRWDALTGFTHHQQLDPTINLSYAPDTDTTLHAGFARYMQVPSFLGISSNVAAAFANTTGAGPNGIAAPMTEDDFEWDAGFVRRITPELSLSEDNFYEITDHYLDTGQFGVVPIFAPFNYRHGTIWGTELAIDYKTRAFSAFANLSLGRNHQQGVATGQFNFDPVELAYIDAHHIVLDHQPLFGLATGATYSWHDWSFGLDADYSSGLRAGFADQDHLPATFQVNASIARGFEVPGIGKVVDRLVLLNVLDRTNLIRPQNGIGIFQSAYGPRFTIYDALTVPL